MATLFDCDGTLVDSEGLGNEVLVEFIAEFGLKLELAEAVRLFRGQKMAHCVQLLAERLGRPLPDGFVPEFRQRLAVAFKDRLRAIDGAAELVACASPPVCVASSGPPEKIRLSLELTGLAPLFGDRIFSSYQIQSWKPEPDLFLHAAKSLGADPAACVVVEDSLPGIQAGLAAGMTVYGFQPFGRDPQIPASVQCVRSLQELQPLIGPARVSRAAGLTGQQS